MSEREKEKKEKNILEGWSRGVWKKEDQDRNTITLQKRFIGILLLLCIFFAVGWMRAPRNLTIHIPPSIHNGATFPVDEIPEAFLYSFCHEIWQGVNYWSEDGTQDYPKNVRTYAAYLTPKFQGELLQDFEELKTAGQVQRQRTLQGITHARFNTASVKKLDANTWEVNIQMRLVEYRYHQIVKDIEMRYPLKVVRWDISSEHNPYGLAIDGYVSAPLRLKDLPSEEGKK